MPPPRALQSGARGGALRRVCARADLPRLAANACFASSTPASAHPDAPERPPHRLHVQIGAACACLAAQTCVASLDRSPRAPRCVCPPAPNPPLCARHRREPPATHAPRSPEKAPGCLFGVVCQPRATEKPARHQRRGRPEKVPTLLQTSAHRAARRRAPPRPRRNNAISALPTSSARVPPSLLADGLCVGRRR